MHRGVDTLSRCSRGSPRASGDARRLERSSFFRRRVDDLTGGDHTQFVADECLLLVRQLWRAFWSEDRLNHNDGRRDARGEEKGKHDALDYHPFERVLTAVDECTECEGENETDHQCTKTNDTGLSSSHELHVIHGVPSREDERIGGCQQYLNNSTYLQKSQRTVH
jgi:hypothetical protein